MATAKFINCPHCLRLTDNAADACVWCSLPLRPPPPPPPVHKTPPRGFGKGFGPKASLRLRMQRLREKLKQMKGRRR